MTKTGIAWTDYSWNPTTGCHKVAKECVNCYAETVSLRKKFTALPWTKANSVHNVVERPDRLKEPSKAKSYIKKGQEKEHPKYPLKIFVNSMSDLFHENVSDTFIEQVFSVMTAPENRQKVFQILTKRAERAATWPGPWTSNIWMGVTCGHPKSKPLIDVLRGCSAKVKFISAEPLLESLIPLDLSGIDWIIVGGESGSDFRPMNMGWAREIRDAAVTSKTAFFFKQDASGCSGQRKYLVEEDGSCWEWLQYANYRISPVIVEPKQLKKHLKLYPQYAQYLA